MLSIFTNRDERKLFAVIGAVLVAALIALAQIDSARNGRANVFSAVVTTVFGVVEAGIAGTGNALRGGFSSIAEIPRLRERIATLREENRALRDENQTLREQAALRPDADDAARAADRYPGAIAAHAIGFDPENQSRAVTIDRGSAAGLRVDQGVVTADGVVGRVAAVQPFSANVLLLIDATSKIPAVVQRGRWWGIATGTGTNIRLEFVSQDAKLRPGDVVVTGEGRSFHAGVPIGRIVSIIHPEGALYQTAILSPAVALGRLSSILVVPH